ncbi:MAG: 2-aminoethylphosphonate--pyruvate transaminase [Acetobacteraceae bacterium]|nr:2-aminoethylphosphonate--pyruvate transaminase [Acetobacteraceae bacterium]
MPTARPPLLLTPGPLTTSDRTRAAMGRDWGSRDRDFIALSEGVRTRLAQLAGAAATHVTVPVQGSGTFAVEAAVQSLVPPDGKLLVLVNGAYGRRIAAIARRLGRAFAILETGENCAIAADAVARALAADDALTDVALVHCETTTGLLNPLPEIAARVAEAGRRLLVDAMSSFGAVPIDISRTPCTALIASANKALEGVPGLAFVIAETAHLRRCQGNAVSLSLDLHDQWRGFEQNGQWRFTPPVQVVAALSAALDQLDAEGGVAARHARYRHNCDTLINGMEACGFTPYIDRALQAPVIVTFRIPPGGWFDFDQFYAFLGARGIVVYPGKLTAEPSFRIGCIGAIGAAEIRRALDAVGAFVAAHRRQRAS